MDYDVIIIGAGLAGRTVALSLPDTFKVAILAKEDLTECASYYAQGGIATVVDATDCIESHVQDTLVAGAGLCCETNVRSILEQAPEALKWLKAQGVIFDEDITHEGGHQHRRISHVADYTGRAVLEKLAVHNVIKCKVTELLVKNGQCYGVQTTQGEMTARHVVLATGGVGQIFSCTTNPRTATADGVALALKAGCQVANMEFIQFHPTALALKGAFHFLISEALRGEGGILKNAHQQRFMLAYDLRAELAPRDIVARAIEREIKLTGAVYLDMTHLDANFIQQHFPQIYTRCLALGLDITKHPIPVAPAVHYSCGGVLTDVLGHTQVKHLYAVGEVACTYLHGANRLASNSLLECVVMGRNTAQDIIEQQTYSIDLVPSAFFIEYYLNSEQAEKIAFSIEHLQQWMTRFFGIVRCVAELKKLYIQLIYWYQATPSQDELITALAMVQSALQRQESRGTHFNQDYPQISSVPVHSIIGFNSK